jgi:hypothetical protein
MTITKAASHIIRIALLSVVFAITYVTGAAVMAGVLPATTSEPGLVPDGVGLAIVVVADTLLITALILTSRWSGWKLALSLAVAYYGVATFMTQIETWYFLTDLTVGPAVLPRLFVMGLPPAFIFIPLAVWMLGKGRVPADTGPNMALVMPARQWAWKLAVIAVVYLGLYWSAGYFIAWQNPALRAFYGHPGDVQPFWAQVMGDLWLIPFQLMRGVLWTLFTLPVVRGSKVSAWWTALLVGLLLCVPQNIGHILPNPLIPIASVRLSHLIETASSTFVFGLVIVWLLNRSHHAVRDLFGRTGRLAPRALAKHQENPA